MVAKHTVTEVLEVQPDAKVVVHKVSKKTFTLAADEDGQGLKLAGSIKKGPIIIPLNAALSGAGSVMLDSDERITITFSSCEKDAEHKAILGADVCKDVAQILSPYDLEDEDD